MAKRRKRLNKGLAVACAIIFLIVGLCLGTFGKIYLFPDDSYLIPETITNNSSITAGDINVDVVKQEDLSIHFIELGNKYTGDCTLINVGEVEILIDAGSRASSVEPIFQYCSQYIDGKLDYVIVTHAHQDHYAGFATNENVPSLFDLFTVETIIKFDLTNQKETGKLYSNFIRELEQTQDEKLTKVYTANECVEEENGATKTFDLGNDVELEILYQKYYEEKATTENDYSVCCMINQGTGSDARHYLFTGDLEAGGESSLVDSNNLPKCELYKAGHHGSKTSSSAKLLAIIQPEIVCVCACAGSSEYTSKNENQFPTQQFIDRIAPYTDAVYVTTLCVDYEKGLFQSMNGNIVVSASAGKETLVSCSASAIKLKETEWFKKNRTCPLDWVA